MGKAKTIELSDLGPIRHLSIPIPEEGGVVVLRGSQGVGKSTALRAAAAAAGKSTRELSVRDGQKTGSIAMPGVTLVVSRARQAKKGSLEIESIEGRFDVGKLIDPQISDEERADASRIKQLIALTGAGADIKAYDALLCKLGLDPIQTIAHDDDLALEQDPILLYATYKRSIERAAIEAEKQASRLPDTCPEKPLVVPDIQELRTAQEECAIELAKLTEREAKSAEMRDALASAENRLAALGQQDARDVAESEQQAIDLHATQQEIVREINRLEARKREIELAEAKAISAAREARMKFDQFLDSTQQVNELRALQSESPTDSQITEARQRLESARRAVQEATKAARDTAEWEKQHEKYARRQQLLADAEKLRGAARDCEKVLAAALPECELRVDGARLVCTTDRAANEPYSELSHGERAIMAIGIVSRYLPTGGLATIAQEIWSGISPDNQQQIHAAAQEAGIVMLTADVSDGELVAEVMPKNRTVK